MGDLELLRRRLGSWARLRVRAEGTEDPALAGLLAGKSATRRRWGTGPAGAAREPREARAEAAVDELPEAGPPRSAGGRAPRPAPSDGGVRILERRAVTDDLLLLRLERPAGFDFVPGQYLRLEVGSLSRKYTIASAPHQPWLEIFVERQPGGKFTPSLFALSPGDRVSVRPKPSGSFALARDVARHLMVATVTGISPFVSMIRAARHRGDGARFFVVHGASHADELGYADELSRTPGVTYLPTVSRPDEPRNAGWTGLTGRVEAHLEATLAEHGLSPGATVIYACGHPQMVKGVRAWARARGYRVRDEDYG